MKNGKNMLKYRIMSNRLINYDLKMLFVHMFINRPFKRQKNDKDSFNYKLNAFK